MVIKSVMTSRLVAGRKGVVVDTCFTFDPKDPTVVTITLRVPDEEPVIWVIAREIVNLGVNGHRYLEEGSEIKIPQTTKESFTLRLISGSESALLAFPRERVRDFMNLVERKIPLDKAYSTIDWDTLLSD